MGMLFITDLDVATPVRKAGRAVSLSMAVAVLWPVWPAHAQIDVNCTRGLLFSTFAPYGAGGQITVTPGGAFTGKNSVAILGTPKQALCKVTKITSTTTGTFSIQVTASKVDITTGGNSMRVDNFNVATSAAGTTKIYTTGTLTQTNFTFGIGARIDTDPTDGVGDYVGALNIKVTYTN